jgi:hypothetical protein
LTSLDGARGMEQALERTIEAVRQDCKQAKPEQRCQAEQGNAEHKDARLMLLCLKGGALRQLAQGRPDFTEIGSKRRLKSSKAEAELLGVCQTMLPNGLEHGGTDLYEWFHVSANHGEPASDVG